MKDLGTLGGTFGFALWVNDAGEIVGGATNQDDLAFLAFFWKNGVMTNLGTVDGDPCSQANMINSKSQIVGTSATCDFFTVQHAFIWEKGQMTDLNTVVPAGSDLQLLDALEINERGEIVGQGAMANGDQHVFLLIPCDRDHFDGEACRENDLGGTTAMQNSASKCSRGSDTHGNCSSHARPAWSESHFRDLATQVIHLTNRRRARKFRLEKA